MRILVWIPIALLLLASLRADSHMLHYLHLKKFLTAVAFARALGKRPTILPIPVPIPIPIAQNEVIKIPIGGGSKTMILDGNKKENKGVGISHLLGSGSPFIGSSPYGYPQPGISTPSVINLSSMKAGESNVVNLASALGGGSSPIIVLRGQGLGPSVIRLSDIGSSNVRLGGIDTLGMDNNVLIRSINGMSSDLDSSFSMKQPILFQRPYDDKPRRKFPMIFRGRRTHDNFSGVKLRNQKHVDGHSTSTLEQQSHDGPRGKLKKPIPVGEKFTYRP